MIRELNNFLRKHLKNVVFFGTLLLAVIFSILSFVPNLPFVVTYHVPFFVLIVAMGNFYIIAQKYINPEKGIIVSSNFNENIKHLIDISSRHGKIKLVDVFAYNTETYFSAIKLALRSNNITIDELRILVYNGDKYDKNPLMCNIAHWYKLQEKNRVKNLSIKFYDFEPSFFCSLYSGNFLHWGLFEKAVDNELIPFDTDVDYAVFGNEKFGCSFISDMQDFFANIWKHHSHENQELIEESLSRK